MRSLLALAETAELSALAEIAELSALAEIAELSILPVYVQTEYRECHWFE